MAGKGLQALKEELEAALKRYDLQSQDLKALEAMLNPGGEPRAKAVLESLSDHSTEPTENAEIQFAYGAPQEVGQ